MSNSVVKKEWSFIRNEEVRKKLALSHERIAKSFDELFHGYSLSAEGVLNEVVRVENYKGLVEVRNIQFYSMCEHHFAPFFGSVDIVYQPDKIITGLGKLVRLAKDVHGRRLQIQETMTKDICQDVMRVLGARGCYVRSRAKHLCICSRGPSDDLAESICSYAQGSLEHWGLEVR